MTYKYPSIKVKLKQMSPETEGKFKKIFNTKIGRETIIIGTAGIVATSLFSIELKQLIMQNLSGIIGGGLITISGLSYLLNKEKSIEQKIEEVFRNVGPGIKKKDGEILIPFCIQKNKEYYGYKMLFNLPSGVSDHDVILQYRKLEVATNSELEMWEQGGKLHMKAYIHELHKEIKYKSSNEIEEYEKLIKDMKLPITLGTSRAGYETLDIVEAQHILNAGETGGGKTNLFRVFAVQLANLDGVRMFIIDVKRNLGFLRKHAWFTYDFSDIQNMVNYISWEMSRRYEFFDQIGIDDLEDLPNEYKKQFPRLILLIDEFSGISPDLARGAEKQERNEILYRIVDLINRGRGCGCYVILGTQRPDRDMMSSGQIKANMAVRFAFRTVGDKDSRIILDNGLAAFLPSDIPGRCIYKGRKEMRQLQVFKLDLKDAKELLPKISKTMPEIFLKLKQTQKDGNINTSGIEHVDTVKITKLKQKII